MPKVYNTKTRGILNPKTDVYIGRPTKWGNPFSHIPNIKGTLYVPSREKAIQMYIEYMDSTQVLNINGHVYRGRFLRTQLYELVGKNLVCWCSPLACHGDHLMQLVHDYELEN